MNLAARFRGFMPVVIDIETGGFDANRHAILEIAAVFLRLDEAGLRIAGSWQQAIRPRPGSAIEDASLKITGIDPTRPGMEEAEGLAELFSIVRDLQREAQCQRSIMVAHNAAFDMGFLNAGIERHKIKRAPFHPFSFIDTASVAAISVGHTVLREACVRAGIPFDTEQAHGALYDAERTADLLCWSVNRWDSECGVWEPE